MRLPYITVLNSHTVRDNDQLRFSQVLRHAVIPRTNLAYRIVREVVGLCVKNFGENTFAINDIELCLFHVLGQGPCPLFGPYSVPIRSRFGPRFGPLFGPTLSRFGPD